MAWQDRTALSATPADNDEVILNDVSDTGDNAAGTVKRNTVVNFIGTTLAALRSAFTPASSSGPASLKLAEDTDNGSNYVALSALPAITTNRAIAFPDADGTVALIETVGSIVASFTDLGDVPNSYTGQSLKGVRVKADETGLEFVTETLVDPSDNTDGTMLVTIAGAWAERTPSQVRSDLGLVIGTNVQAQDAELAAIAGLTSAADKVPYFTGLGTATLATLTSAARTVLDDTSTAAMLATLGGQPLDADLTTLSTAFVSASASGPASLALHEDTDNGTNKVTLIAPANIAADATVTIPGTTGTAYVSTGTDVAITDGGTGASDAATAFSNLKQAASESATGVVALATAAEITTGTDATRAICPDQFAGSDYGKRVVSVLLNDSTALTTGDGKTYWRVPLAINGWKLVAIGAARVAGTGVLSIQLARIRSGTPTDLLSTNVTIDDSEVDTITAATPAVIITTSSTDVVNTGDRLRFDVDAAGTGSTWVEVQLTFQAP